MKLGWGMNGNFFLFAIAAQKSNVVGDVKQAKHSSNKQKKNQFKFIVLFHSIGNRTFLDGIKNLITTDTEQKLGKRHDDDDDKSTIHTNKN